MKKPRSRKRRKLGKISQSTERNISQKFQSKDATEIPGHFMYNKDDDAIQQVLRLPDISVGETNEGKESCGRTLSLPPINSDPRGHSTDRRQCGDATKLPRIAPDGSVRGSRAAGRRSSWLERQDVTCISWKKALNALDSSNEAEESTGRETTV